MSQDTDVTQWVVSSTDSGKWLTQLEQVQSSIPEDEQTIKFEQEDLHDADADPEIKALEALIGAHEDIDYFFIPTTPKPKQQTDTINTINELQELGVEDEQLKIIFNFFDDNIPPQSLYNQIFNHQIAKDLNLDNADNIITITDNPCFDMIGELGYTFSEIANDERDFKSLIRSTDDKEERAHYSHLRSAQRLAKGFTKELDITFDKIMSSCNIKF